MGKFRKFLVKNGLLEGKVAGIPDGTGPNKKSAMAQADHKGSKTGMKKGDCPNRKDFETEEDYNII
jgi:hypothetical protein